MNALELAAADVVSLCALEELRAKLAPAGTVACEGCACVRFLADGRCALCGAQR